MTNVTACNYTFEHFERQIQKKRILCEYIKRKLFAIKICVINTAKFDTPKEAKVVNQYIAF